MVEKRLLAAQDIRREYGIGKGTVYRLLSRLPSVKIGKRRLLLRSDLEQFLSEAARDGVDVLRLLKGEDPTEN